MMPWLWVAGGGALGSLLRYGLSVWMPVSVGHFPWATWWANILGCGLAGVFLAGSERFACLQGEMRLFLLVGILGGFTTFSSFGLESFNLLRHDHVPLALCYVASSVLSGFSALALMYAICRYIWA